LTKKLTPLKAASAVFAGMLVLGSGMAVAAADLSDHSKPADVVAGHTDAPFVAHPGDDINDDNDGTEVDDDNGVEIDGDSDEADHDDADQGDVKDAKDDDGDEVESGDAGDDQGEHQAPVHPENHGALVSQAAHSEAPSADDSSNHGAGVSAIARDNAGKDKSGDHGDDEVAPPAPATPPTVGQGDDDSDQDEVEVDDDQGENDGDHGTEAAEHRGDQDRHDDEDAD
jgi:hypothetical protein